MPDKAMKHDTGKARHHLLIDEFIDEMIKVRMMGSKKYEPWDWIHGLEFSRYQDAIKRHLKEFNAGEDLDFESKLHHMAHIAISAMFLFTFQMLGAGVDDRHGVKAERILKRLRAEVAGLGDAPDAEVKKDYPVKTQERFEKALGYLRKKPDFMGQPVQEQFDKSCLNCRHHYSEVGCVIDQAIDKDHEYCIGWASRKVSAS